MKLIYYIWERATLSRITMLLVLASLLACALIGFGGDK